MELLEWGGAVGVVLSGWSSMERLEWCGAVWSGMERLEWYGTIGVVGPVFMSDKQ